jgi:hypothetical protein
MDAERVCDALAGPIRRRQEYRPNPTSPRSRACANARNATRRSSLPATAASSAIGAAQVRAVVVPCGNSKVIATLANR